MSQNPGPRISYHWWWPAILKFMRILSAAAALLAAPLTAAISEGIDSGRASDFYVHSLPHVRDASVLPEMHAGRLNIGAQMEHVDANMFFWHFRSSFPSNKTIVWFNGGPGCSSMDGALLELGPLRFTDDSPELQALKPGSGAWTDTSNLLFLDQPFGTGFSDPGVDGWAKSLEEAADAVSLFLKEYASIFPEFLDTEIFLAGESYAGQYVPHVFRKIHHEGIATDTSANSPTTIRGLILINPWIDPANQYLSYAPFIKERQLIAPSDYEGLDVINRQCINALAAGNYKASVKECEDITRYLNLHYKKTNKCYNAYDISLESPQPSCGMEWPPALPQVGRWLNREDVQSALHVNTNNEERFSKSTDGIVNHVERSTTKWQECSASVQRYLNEGQLSREFLPEILEAVPLLLMIGDNDYICNYVGLEKMVHSMTWGGSTGFNENGVLRNTSWGTIRSERKLTMAQVYNASHMIPYDHLLESQSVLNQWFTEIGAGGQSATNSSEIESPSKSPSRAEIDHAVAHAYKMAALAFVLVIFALVLVGGGLWYCKCGNGTILKYTGKSSSPDYVPLDNIDTSQDDFRV